MPTTSKKKGVVSAAPLVEVDDTPTLAYDRPSAITNFQTASANWHQGSLQLVAAATVVFVVAYVEERSSAKVVADLQAAVRERGLKTAQVYRYLGLARALVTELTRNDHGRTTRDGRVLAEVEDAKTPEEATDALLAYFEKRKLTSLDKLGTMLGVYKRAPKASEREDADESADATPARVVAAIKRLPVAGLVEALHAAEADPVEVVDAIAERASASALRTMLDHLQQRLIQLEGAAPQNGNAWRDRENQKSANLQ